MEEILGVAWVKGKSRIVLATVCYIESAFNSENTSYQFVASISCTSRSLHKKIVPRSLQAWNSFFRSTKTEIHREKKEAPSMTCR
jgi:hypothetical protein